MSVILGALSGYCLMAAYIRRRAGESYVGSVVVGLAAFAAGLVLELAR